MKKLILYLIVCIQSKKFHLKMLFLNQADDLASKDSGGDLGLSSGDAFPEEFENAILSMQLKFY